MVYLYFTGWFTSSQPVRAISCQRQPTPFSVIGSTTCTFESPLKTTMPNIFLNSSPFSMLLFTSVCSCLHHKCARQDWLECVHFISWHYDCIASKISQETDLATLKCSSSLPWRTFCCFGHAAFHAHSPGLITRQCPNTHPLLSPGRKCK